MLEAMMEFFAYGHAKSRFWAIGLEEHCEGETDIKRRIELRTAKPEQFLDVERFHLDLQKKMPAHVPVWSNARQIYRGVYGEDTEPGRLDPAKSDLLLGEILPLPRPQHHLWPENYKQWFDTPRDYIRKVRPQMVRRLLDMVAKHEPEIVLLHGKSQHNQWIQRPDSPLRTGWHSELVADSTRHTVLWQCVNGTLWVRTNNLVNNAYVRFGAAQIEQIVRIIRNALPTCRP